jgi:hypothetical protein
MANLENTFVGWVMEFHDSFVQKGIVKSIRRLWNSNLLILVREVLCEMFKDMLILSSFWKIYVILSWKMYT